MKYIHKNKKITGVVVPLSALRTSLSPGCGEFPDLVDFGKLMGKWGMELIQLLPVNDSGLHNSPYFALSAFALNPIYVRITDIEEFVAAPNSAVEKAAKDLVSKYAAVERIKYGDLRNDKAAVFEMLWAALDGGSNAGSTYAVLDEWASRHPWAKIYSAFVVQKKREDNRAWWGWQSMQNPTQADLEALWSDQNALGELYFHLWLQKAAHQQFEKATKVLSDLKIDVMGDLPILLNRDSADVWFNRSIFNLSLSAGAPPDMYSPDGQNWGFPTYAWESIEATCYAYWKDRLADADVFYSAYRIDHVLGFFRIWTIQEHDDSAMLGRFDPEVAVTVEDLRDCGFTQDRVRWLSLPHIRGDAMRAALNDAAAFNAQRMLLQRIGEEDLFLFLDAVRGQKDIDAAPTLSPEARDFLKKAWLNRVLVSRNDGSYSFAWSRSGASAWASLSDAERAALDRLYTKKREQSLAIWESRGEAHLKQLCAASEMLVCAEDLGDVPECVPRVLERNGILGLRVLRWTRDWAQQGQPFVAVDKYPLLSVATTSVHDSSALRQWWAEEVQRQQLWDFASATLGRDLGPCPDQDDAAAIPVVLELLATSASQLAVFPIQDLLALSAKAREQGPASERINLPGTVGEHNWSYRMPMSIDDAIKDKDLAAMVNAIGALRK